jgi:FixJ family two-component response regulator
LNGFDLLDILSQMDGAIPIIVMSAAYAEIRAQALERGAIEVLGKPFRGEALLAAVKSAVESDRRS